MANYSLVNPDDPLLLQTRASTFGGPDDAEDNGQFASGGVGSTLPDGTINPEPYVAVPHEFWESGAVRRGQRVRLINPATGTEAFGVARDSGPSAHGRGIDLAPHLMQQLGSDTDDPIQVDFSDYGYSDDPDTMEAGGGLGDIGTDQSDTYQDAYQDSTDTTAPADETLDPDQATVDDDGTVHFHNGLTVHVDGTVERNTGKLTYTYVPGAAQPHITTATAPTVHWRKDPSTGVDTPYALKNGEFVPVPFHTSDGQEAGMMSPEPGVTGEDALKTLSPKDQDIVKSYANYELSPPTGGRRGDPNFFRLHEYIKAYKPDYDVRDFQVGLQLKKQFNSGLPTTPGGQIVSVNTAISHLGTLYRAALALDNGNYRKWNSLTKYFANETGDPAIAAFEDARNRVGTEIARAFRGGVPTNLDQEEFSKAISKANSPAQLAAVIKGTIPEMLNARLSEIGFVWEDHFGKPFHGLVRPAAKKVLDEWGIQNFGQENDLDQPSGTTSGATAGATPPPVLADGSVPEEGQAYTDPVSGITKVWRNGHWE